MLFRSYSSKIDIWSLGCVVFEMWTGERPWGGQEAVAVLLQVRSLHQLSGRHRRTPFLSSTNHKSAPHCRRMLLCLLRRTTSVNAVSLWTLVNGQPLEGCGSIHMLYSHPIGNSMASNEDVEHWTLYHLPYILLVIILLPLILLDSPLFQFCPRSFFSLSRTSSFHPSSRRCCRSLTAVCISVDRFPRNMTQLIVRPIVSRHASRHRGVSFQPGCRAPIPSKGNKLGLYSVGNGLSKCLQL